MESCKTVNCLIQKLESEPRTVMLILSLAVVSDLLGLHRRRLLAWGAVARGERVSDGLGPSVDGWRR